ncbi:MAG: hypothetical protein JXO22_18125 [Phycisphaerae bacterium]|nr:hypothetical protein [Phycisphaerae bacterium]
MRQLFKARRGVQEAFGPPITAEEQSTNLTVLENRFNKDMKCPAGRNQVYVRSLLTGSGTTRPRIALKCPLRKDIGLTPEIFFEEIRDLCCGDPDKCEAWQKLKDRFVDT